VVRLIRRQLIKRSLDMIAEIAGREDKKVGEPAEGVGPFCGKQGSCVAVRSCQAAPARRQPRSLDLRGVFLFCYVMLDSPSCPAGLRRLLGVVWALCEAGLHRGRGGCLHAAAAAWPAKPETINSAPGPPHRCCLMLVPAYIPPPPHTQSHTHTHTTTTPAQDNRKALAPLLRFPSSGVAAEQGLTSLADYVSRKKEGQTQIYYLAGGQQQMPSLHVHPLLRCFCQSFPCGTASTHRISLCVQTVCLPCICQAACLPTRSPPSFCSRLSRRRRGLPVRGVAHAARLRGALLRRCRLMGSAWALGSLWGPLCSGLACHGSSSRHLLPGGTAFASSKGGAAGGSRARLSSQPGAQPLCWCPATSPLPARTFPVCCTTLYCLTHAGVVPY
jgi:hypothetical protein